MLAEGEENTAVQAASELAFDDVEAILLATEKPDEWKPGDPAIIKNIKQGSFEKLMGAFAPKR